MFPKVAVFVVIWFECECVTENRPADKHGAEYCLLSATRTNRDKDSGRELSVTLQFEVKYYSLSSAVPPAFSAFSFKTSEINLLKVQRFKDPSLDNCKIVHRLTFNQIFFVLFMLSKTSVGLILQQKYSYEKNGLWNANLQHFQNE